MYANMPMRIGYPDICDTTIDVYSERPEARRKRHNGHIGHRIK